MASKSKTQRADMDAMADAVLERQKGYLESLFSRSDEKLTAIHAQLASLTASLGAIRSDVGTLKTAVESNSNTLDDYGQTLQELQVKLADMEDRNRRCNIRIIGLKEGLEGSNAIQFLSRSLPQWFPNLSDVQVEIMRAHRIYSDSAKGNNTDNRTLIFNVLRYTTRQAILQAARRSPPVVAGRKIRFAPDYSGFTVKRRQAFSPIMDSARAKGLDFFLIYPATLKIKDGPRYRAFTSAKEAEDYVARAALLRTVAAETTSIAENAVEEAQA